MRLFILICVLLLVPTLAAAQTDALFERLRGHVLLDVGGRGEAWYVHPADGARHYLRDGNAAYELMRRFSLGVSEADFERLAAGDAALRARLRGRIVLRAHAHGEAYYLCPRTGEFTYLRDGAAAYGVMSRCGLGITRADLGRVPIAPDSATPPSDTSSARPPAPTPPPSTAPSGEAVTGAPTVAGCRVFPADNPWNRDISELPVHTNSAAYVHAIGGDRGLHPDFGENPDYGIPYNISDANTPRHTVTFDDYGDESDTGEYPIPLRPEIEAGSDQHILTLDRSTCTLYELHNASLNDLSRGTGWVASSGAIWDLGSNALRPENWTSADAAGLPLFPGLVRYDEVAHGEIRHAIRFTAPRTQAAHIHPATHHAGSNDPSLPPMGLRVRLKAGYDISGLPTQARVIARAMQTYGMILADNGSAWYFQGAYSPGWNDDELNMLKTIPGSAFEAVDTGPLIK